MKKLKLKVFELGTTEVLTRTQLRNLMGGVQNTGASTCSIGFSCTVVDYWPGTGQTYHGVCVVFSGVCGCKSGTNVWTIGNPCGFS